jgi:uncharacterized protein with NRDE domain
MCLALFAHKVISRYPLLFLANRDEFYDRPTAAADFWKDTSSMLGGRDLRMGGTWLGVTRNARFAAVTNFRKGFTQKKNAPSRGRLVSDFLQGNEKAEDYLRRLEKRSDDYDGFNLLLGEAGEIYYYANHSGELKQLAPGLYGLSNHLLDTPWPKVERGKSRLAALFATAQPPDSEALFAVLAERHIAADAELPDTGVGLEWERMLSPAFIITPDYGTRSSTLLFIGSDRRIMFIERSFERSVDAGSVSYEFVIPSTDS